MSDSSTNARQNHPKTKIQVLEKWVYDHLEYPYPTEREKEQLLEAARMNKRQEAGFFAVRVFELNAPCLTGEV